jgi:hypothetical protein
VSIPEGPSHRRAPWIYPALIAGAFLLFDAFAAPRLLAPGVEDLGPIELSAGQEELILTGVSIPGEPLLRHEGTADLNLDVEASKARLDPSSFSAFRQFARQEPPVSFGKLHYFSLPASAAAPVSCRMNFRADVQGSPRVVDLYIAEGKPESNRLRSILLTPRGADLRIELEPVVPPEEPATAAIGCQRRLQIGGPEKAPPMSLTLRFLVAQGSQLTLTFGSPKPWGNLELLDLSQLHIDSLRIARTADPQRRRDTATRLAIASRGGRSDLRMESLRSAGDKLQVIVSGSGTVVSGADARSVLRSLGRRPVTFGLLLFALLAHGWPAAWLLRALRDWRRGDLSTVFISYSHADEAWKDRLVKHLGALALKGELEVWHDHRIGAGEKWYRAIQAALARARIAVLLISPDFLGSDFILEKEVPVILARQEAGLLVVIPVIVRPSEWETVKWLAEFQCRPWGGRPLSQGSYDEIYEALAGLALEIRDLLRGGSGAPS